MKRGQREYMEDFVTVAELPEGRVAMVLCDGHGGDRCARYVSQNMLKLMKDMPPGDFDLKSRVQAVSRNWDKQCLKKLKCKDYPKTAEERTKIFDNQTKYLEEGWHAGTTLVALLLDVLNKTGVVANVGDSRAVWKDFGQGTNLRSTPDHTPTEHCMGPIKGVITTEEGDVPRINGDLSVGRALGDNSPELMCTVNHDPEIKNFSWDKGPFRVVLGTDGVWDVLKNPEAMRLSSAHKMVSLALEKGTTDNVSVGIVDVTYPPKKDMVVNIVHG